MTDQSVRISLVVHALDRNPIVRAAPIAQALQRLGFEVEITGVIGSGCEIYEPYRNSFDFYPAPSHWQLTSCIRGDAVYSFKPLPTTLLPSMLATRFGRDKPVLLDVEDDDYGVCQRRPLTRCLKGMRDLGRRPTGYLNSLTHRMRHCCDAITVSTSMLGQFYGGTKLLHGPDECAFDPVRSGYSKDRCRKEFDLPTGQGLVLFAGRPSTHKGFDEIVEAVANTQCALVLAGDSSNSLFRAAALRLGDRCHRVGMVSNERMPDLLHAVDIVPVPLHDVPFARAQLPAKLVEAMAMSKAVIVSSVGDLGDIVNPAGGPECGWVVSPGNPVALAEAIREIDSNQQLRIRRGRDARDYFVRHASVAANASALRTLFHNTPRLRPLIERVEKRRSVEAISRPHGMSA